MTNELTTLVTIVSISVPIGLAVGMVCRKRFPAGVKRWAKYCMGARWGLFTFGALFFGGMAALSFWAGNPYFGWFFLGFAVLEIWALISSGFKPLSKELEQRIDESDPTKLLPLKFWK